MRGILCFSLVLVYLLIRAYTHHNICLWFSHNVCLVVNFYVSDVGLCLIGIGRE